MSECRLQLQQGILSLHGVLDKNNAHQVYLHSKQLLSSGQAPDCIDLGHVDHIDSAGLALLLEWQSWANHARHKLQLQHAPKQLLMLARLSELDRILNLGPVNSPQGIAA